MTDRKVIPFNPLDKRHLGESVGQAMLRQAVDPMSGLESFEGAGIYAIYYLGSFPAYQTIAECNLNEGASRPNKLAVQTLPSPGIMRMIAHPSLRRVL